MYRCYSKPPSYPVIEDYNNISRPQGAGYDMGAYEASGGASASIGMYLHINPFQCLGE